MKCLRLTLIAADIDGLRQHAVRHLVFLLVVVVVLLGGRGVFLLCFVFVLGSFVFWLLLCGGGVWGGGVVCLI